MIVVLVLEVLEVVRAVVGMVLVLLLAGISDDIVVNISETVLVVRLWGIF